MEANKIYKIEWVDPEVGNTWIDKDDNDIEYSVVTTFGLIWKIDDKYVEIAPSFSENQALGTLVIPKACILNYYEISESNKIL